MKKILTILFGVLLLLTAFYACRKIKNPTMPSAFTPTITQTTYLSVTPTRTISASFTATITVTATITNTPVWGGGQVSSGTARWPTLGGYNGNVYLVYVDVPNGEKATVKMLSGSSWVNVGTGAISTGRSDRTTIYVVDNSNIYVAYEELDNSNKLTVKYYNGSAWSTVGTEGFVGGSGDQISQQALCVDAGIPYIAFTTGSSGQVYSYNGGWAEVGLDFYSQVCWYVGIRFYAGVPYVSYQDNSPYNATVKYLSAGTWNVYGGGDVMSSTTEGISMAIYNGNVNVAFRQTGVNSKVAVKTSSGSSWAYLGSSSGFSPGTATINNYIFADETGNLYVLYGDNNNSGRANCAIYNAGSWLDVGTEGFSVGQIDEATLYVYGGTVYAAYDDAGLGNAACGMVH